MRGMIFLFALALASVIACNNGASGEAQRGASHMLTDDDSTRERSHKENAHMFTVRKSEKEWRAQLSPQAYRVVREKGTEAPFSGEYDDHFEQGSYTCIGCGETLFSSESKFDSRCGWPSFSSPFAEKTLLLSEDNTLGMTRTEVQCPKCGAHLGHVFNDGPAPTGLRYCINSVSLDFEAGTDAGSKQNADTE